MRYSLIDIFEIVNGKDVGVSLYTQGCNRRCKGCFNPKAWDLEGGKEYTEETKNYIIESCNREGIKRFTIVGGEPLLERNIKDLIELCSEIKVSKPDINIWLYTGNTFEEVVNQYKDLFDLVDVCVDGPFILDLRDITLEFRGSSNQRVIDVNKTLEKGEVVLYEYC